MLQEYPFDYLSDCNQKWARPVALLVARARRHCCCGINLMTARLKEFNVVHSFLLATEMSTHNEGIVEHGLFLCLQAVASCRQAFGSCLAASICLLGGPPGAFMAACTSLAACAGLCACTCCHVSPRPSGYCPFFLAFHPQNFAHKWACAGAGKLPMDTEIRECWMCEDASTAVLAGMFQCVQAEPAFCIIHLFMEVLSHADPHARLVLHGGSTE